MRTKAPDQVEIRIPRRAEFVRVARMAACALASQLDFTYDEMKDIELATGEACANSVEHAGGEECKDLVVRFEVEPEALVIEVEDNGQGFDSEAVSANEEVLDWGSPRGCGLSIMRTLMDEVHISSGPDRGTRVRMVKRRTGKVG